MIITGADIIKIHNWPKIERLFYEEPDDLGQWMVAKPVGILRYSDMVFEARPDLFSDYSQALGNTVTVEMSSRGAGNEALSSSITFNAIVMEITVEPGTILAVRERVIVRLRITGAIINNTKEDTVKVFEAVIIGYDKDGNLEDVVKVIPPFVARNANEARDRVLVDYAHENNISGKDLSGYQVRTREFPIGAL